ncbi:MAG TPA: hypothetical protein VJS20_10670, partial [Gemmatimonadales bacterium]|nr:hypothetical protein [Gemmatimonadales bacterium]
FNSTSTRPYSLVERFVPYDSAAARRFGISFTTDARMPLRYTAAAIPIYQTSSGVAMAVGRYGIGPVSARQTTRYLAHSRWFDGTGNEPPDPTITACPDAAHNSGRLTGVGRIWAPQAYRDLTTANAAGPCPLAAINLNLRGFALAQTAWYPADFVVTWNADSSLTVRDSSHRLNLPFKAGGGTGWGFLNLRALLAAGVTAGTGDTATDVNDGTGTPSMTALGYHHLYATRPTCTPEWWGIPCVSLERTAQYQPLDFNADGTADATGIALLVNGEAYFMELGAIPAAGTRWRLRAVTGSVGATCGPALGPAMTDCTAYTFTEPLVRPSYAPGLRYTVTVQPAYTVDSLVSGDMARVHTVPDPLYVASGYELTPDTAALKFVNLPSRAIIRIYSVSGILVAAIVHNDPTGGGEATWNVRSRTGRRVASGVYFYHVEGPDGRTKVGRFTVITGPGRGS